METVEDNRARQTDIVAGGRADGGRLRSLLRRLVEPLLFVGLVGAALAAVAFRGGHSSTVDGSPPVGSTTEATMADGAEPSPAHLIVPALVRAGELVTVVGFEHRDGCAPVSLVLDERAVVYAAFGHTADDGATWRELFLTFEVPNVPPGPRQLRLLGPVPGGLRGGHLCGDTPQQVKQLDSTIITIS